MSQTQTQQPITDTVKTQLASMSLENASQKAEIERLTQENEVLKTQNAELASVIENDLKADLTVRIQAASAYTPEELSVLNVEQLKNIEETLSKTGAFTAKFKPIRAGNAGLDHSARLTVGDKFYEANPQFKVK
jgi:hypothetical protein